MDAHTIVRAFALVARVGRLNPFAGEIGPGMLAILVQEAREVAGAVSSGGGFYVATHDHSGVIADGLLMRQVLAVSIDQTKAETFGDVVDGIEAAHGWTPPTTIADARTRLQDAIDQTNRIHPS